MKKLVILILLLNFHLAVNAETQPGKQIEDAKFKIVKATIEFLASDKEQFNDVKEIKCGKCKSYEELTAYVLKNKLTNANVLIEDWQKNKVDSSLSGWKESLTKFKNNVEKKITSGSKAKEKRKSLPNYKAYISDLNLIIANVSIPETVSVVAKTPEELDSVESPLLNKNADKISEKILEQESYFDSLPNIFKDMYYAIIFLLLAIIAYLIWMFTNKNKALQNKVRSLEGKLIKVENTEWQSKKISADLKIASQKLKDAEKEIAVLQENLKAETERNQRLSAVPAIEKPVVEIPVSSSAPVIKYARYADQGDGFSVLELLDEEDSETIFELTILSPNLASFKISSNSNAQRYALSNSPYFLGKTSQYDTFPSGNSLINTDVPGELKLQGNKWLIVKPALISFT